MATTYWLQRIKEYHLQVGDIPSKLLFNRLRQKKQRNYVYMLRNQEGNWVENGQEIALMIQHHFKALYQPSTTTTLDNLLHGSEIDLVLRELDLPCLQEPDKQMLLQHISDQEIRDAMFSIANNKSPGMDGFTSEFYKLYWDDIGPLVIQAVQRFFSTGHLLKEWNKTLLVLIPKVSPPEEVSHFRPISLCNVVYKCIAKCLVNRMRHLLPRLISDMQNAFIPGRHMDDNILISHELTHIINKQRSGDRQFAALKLVIHN